MQSLHPSQKHGGRRRWALVRSNEHERFVAGKAERLAKQMASMTPPSSAAAAAAKPQLKRRKGQIMTAAQNLHLQLRMWKGSSMTPLHESGGSRVLCSEWMDLPKDGPDRPACTVMWYSAPLAEELCQGYRGVKHALHFKNLATCNTLRKNLALARSQGKSLPFPHLVGKSHTNLLFSYRTQEHARPPLCILSMTISEHHDMVMQLIAMCRAGPSSQADRRKQGPLSRAWGLRGQRIGEARQPGPATEAVGTRKGDGQEPQELTASTVNPVQPLVH